MVTDAPKKVTDPAASGIRVDTSLRWLLGIFLGGLMLVIGLRVFFASLQEETRQRSANERARLFVGEEIVRGIHGIEKDIYQMGVTTNPAGVKLARRSMDKQMDKLVHDLGVLKEGGTVKREVLLNLEGRDEMVREASYRPPAGEQTYIMELIEIAPLLEQIRSKTDQLSNLLETRWDAQDANDKKRFFDGEQEISTFLKHIPPFFQRLDENANRLFFDSSERLRTLEAQLALQRQRLAMVEIGLIGLVVILVSLAGMIVARRIGRSNLARERALDEARAAKEEAERASRAKSEFVSRMSHELRTPLNAIIGFAELLEAEPLPPSQKNYVGLINSSGNHLMELINAVLDHAKIEAGGLTLEKISFDFPATIDAVHSIVLDRASAKGLEFVAVIDKNLPRRVVGDPTRLRQVLINLLVNAVKFTDSGSVELRVAVDDGMLIFSIRDSGIGMSEAVLGRLFQPFAQADDSITRKYGGTGLGLMISKELIEAMGGTIEVESATGIGSCFWIRLPLRLGDTASPVAAPEVSSQLSTSSAELINGRVLLVDDNRVNQQLGAAMLERLGLVFDIADNGAHALQRIADSAYALVLMDMEMPVMDGLTATSTLRSNEKEGTDGKRLPVIAMTANALTEDRERCFAVGMDGYISKPISLAALEKEIARVFGGVVSTTKPVALRAPVATGPVFDHAKALDMIGDEELLRQLSDMFIADTPEYLAELDAALTTEDWPRLGRSAHTLKSLFGTFAADAAAADAQVLEHTAMSGDGPLCLQLAPAVRAHTEALAFALAAA